MNGFSKDSATATRLPSFQQLIRTFHEPEVAPPPYGGGSSSGSGSGGGLGGGPIQQQQQQRLAHGSIDANAFGGGPNFNNYILFSSHGNTTTEFPRQYREESFSSKPPYGTNPDMTHNANSFAVRSIAPSPTTMARGRSLSFSYLGSTAHELVAELDKPTNEYQFVAELVKFLLRFENKCGDIQSGEQNNLENMLQITEKAVVDLPIEELDDAIANATKLVEILEKIRGLSEKKRSINVRRSSSFMFENGKRKIDKRKQPTNKRKKSMTSLTSSGGEIVPLDIHVPNSSIGHQQQFGVGGLNAELSIKPDITCQHCCSQETPEWRRGPEGSRTLCNACGLFYSKLIKKYGLQEADKVMYERKQTGTINDRRIF